MRAHMLAQWRGVVDKYADEFNVSVLHDDGLYLDLLENMPTDIWQSLVATLIAMALICAVFMSNMFVVVVTTAVIAMVMIGTLFKLKQLGLLLSSMDLKTSSFKPAVRRI